MTASWVWDKATHWLVSPLVWLVKLNIDWGIPKTALNLGKDAMHCGIPNDRQFESVHYGDVIMGTMASQITSLAIVYSTVYSGRSRKISKLRVTGLCVGNSPGTGEFPAQMASNAENVSIWWRHHAWNLQAQSIGTKWLFADRNKRCSWLSGSQLNFIVKASWHLE